MLVRDARLTSDSAVESTAMIDIRGLSKRYESYPAAVGEVSGLLHWVTQLRRRLRLTAEAPRRVVALDDVDLSVQQGEILGLMGPNGAGKTTLIKILCGLLEPSSGSGRVAGYDLSTERAGIKRSISYVSTTGWMGLEWALTVEENLLLYARLFGLPADAARQRAREALAAVNLSSQAGKHVYQLSSGMRQRTVIARGLLVQTPLLFLDEPTVGLDPVTARDLRQLVKDDLNRQRGQTIIITSHFAGELELLCDRVGILVGGRLIALGTLDDLRQVVADRTVVDLRASGLLPEIIDALRDQPGILHVAMTLHDAGAGTGRLRLHLARERPVGPVLGFLGERGVSVRWVGTAEPGLEDAFLARTGTSLA